jgi:CDP-glucose 4,6-dehydratase
MEELVKSPSLSFWTEKRVLITGHTGFKGSWLAYWLTKLGANVTGIGLEPVNSPSLYSLLSLDKVIVSHINDILNYEKYSKIFRNSNPEIIFHLAAQPLVRESYLQPVKTFSTNLMGTINTLELIRLTESVRCAVIVTTDKVYENNDSIYPFRETDPLGGHDPYSASKATCEIAVNSFRKSFFDKNGTASIATARAGNIIGGGDWSSDRLIPDAIRAWNSNSILKIRYPNATRPWQHVLDPLNGYIKLAEEIYSAKKLGSAYNFGPDTSSFASVKDVINKAKIAYGKGEVYYESNYDGPYEANTLSLDTSKTKKILNLKPNWDLNSSINKTINWYKELSNGVSAQKLCDIDLKDYKIEKNEKNEKLN